MEWFSWSDDAERSAIQRARLPADSGASPRTRCTLEAASRTGFTSIRYEGTQAMALISDAASCSDDGHAAASLGKATLRCGSDSECKGDNLAPDIERGCPFVDAEQHEERHADPANGDQDAGDSQNQFRRAHHGSGRGTIWWWRLLIWRLSVPRADG